MEENENGGFTFSYPLADTLNPSLSVYKNGYYLATSDLPKKRMGERYALIISLKPKQNPIPLIAFRWMGDEAPFLYSGIKSIKYYDCLKADWLPPNGKGEKADLMFSYHRYSKGEKTFMWFKVCFTNPNDGFEEVTESYAEDMRIREAPPTRHLQNQFDIIEELNSDGLPFKHPKMKNYAFRVRTQLTPSGNILSAYYGKFYNAFDFNFLKESCLCGFEYYLNPTPNNRNLEYNGKSINKPKRCASNVSDLR